MDGVFFAVVVLMCASIFIGMGVYSFKRKSPMFFWAGMEIKENEITNVTLYNRDNGLMWITFGLVYVLWAVLALILSPRVIAVPFIVSSFAGVIVLMIIYQKILNKYRIQ